jgi:hypothetical protein
MKNMKNYEAPKAEVIELDVNKDFMFGGGSTPQATQTSNLYS